MKKKILLVEDERDIAYVLSEIFKKEGYSLAVAGSGEDGLRKAREWGPDLVISDIMLPKMDGLQMVEEIRRESEIPVLFLTARKDEIDRVRGLTLGADDYLAKPFSMRELVCRVKAVLRRRERAERQAAPGAPVRLGGLEVDFSRHEVRVRGKARHLAPREFQILRMLIEANGKVLSRVRLLKTIWGYDEGLGIDTRTVDQHVARLRRNLLSERRRVVTVKNFGYQIRMSEDG